MSDGAPTSLDILDSIVAGNAYLPDAETTLILSCSKGPKSLVALFLHCL